MGENNFAYVCRRVRTDESCIEILDATQRINNACNLNKLVGIFVSERIVSEHLRIPIPIRSIPEVEKTYKGKYIPF